MALELDLDRWMNFYLLSGERTLRKKALVEARPAGTRLWDPGATMGQVGKPGAPCRLWGLCQDFGDRELGALRGFS